MQSRFLLLSATLCAAGVLACADSVAPDAAAAVDSTGASAALLNDTSAQLSTSSGSLAVILDYWVDVGFQDDFAYGQGHMIFRGTSGEVTTFLTLRTPTATVATTEATRGVYGLPFFTHSATSSAVLAVSKPCGYLAQARAEFRASDGIPPTPKTPGFTWGHVAESGDNWAHQPDCAPPCVAGGTGTSSGELAAVYDVAYDPYATTEASCGGTGGTTGGTGGTGGTQYGPGDPTGGETVDWGTGIGNGGTSVCGQLAVVEYVCIDIYNESTGKWEQYSCGYATTC